MDKNNLKIGTKILSIKSQMFNGHYVGNGLIFEIKKQGEKGVYFYDPYAKKYFPYISENFDIIK